MRTRSNLNERDRIILFAAEHGIKRCKLTLFTCINRSSLIAPLLRLRKYNLNRGVTKHGF